MADLLQYSSKYFYLLFFSPESKSFSKQMRLLRKVKFEG